MRVKVCILRIEGTNCELETALAFNRLGAHAEVVHLKQLTGAVSERERRNLADYHLLVIPGGFSAGDYVRAGAIFAARLRGNLSEEMEEFIGEGKPVLGICNGFQVLVELGLLPGISTTTSTGTGTGEGERAAAALTTNSSARFECRPTLLKHENRGKCIFTRGIEEGAVLKMPCAHAEGRFFLADERYIQQMEDNDQIVFRYVDPAGDYASYPWNPNGSVSNIAAICNPEGNIMGLMPHPERAFYSYLDAEWWRRKRGRRMRGMGEVYGDGERIFESILNHLQAHVYI